MKQRWTCGFSETLRCGVQCLLTYRTHPQTSVRSVCSFRQETEGSLFTRYGAIEEQTVEIGSGEYMRQAKSNTGSSAVMNIAWRI